MSPYCRASADGRVWSQRPRSIRACAMGRSALSVQRRTSQHIRAAAASCGYSSSRADRAGRMRRNPIPRTPTAHSWRPAMRSRGNSGKGGRSCCLGLVAIALVINAALSSPSPLVAAEKDELKVCADPNNLPFSNADGAGFENKLAGLVAAEPGKKVTSTWWAARRGFVHNTLNSGLCHVVMGVPADYELVETTRPCYRSSYVFVSRADRNLNV